MKCLVTGGTGFLGRHLVRQLIEEGHTVRLLARHRPLPPEPAGDDEESAREELPDPSPSPDPADELGAEAVRGDVLDPSSLPAALQGIEVVYHLAGKVQHKGEPTELFRLHVDGTRHVLNAAAAAGVGRFVHMSTSGTVAVSRDRERIADESAPFAIETVRRWPYYLSKIYAEKLALEAHVEGKLPVVVLNPSLLLGPEDVGRSSSEVLVSFLRREIPAIPTGGMNFVDVRDVALAAAAAATRGRPGGRYLLGGPNMTLEAFFVMLSKVSGVPAPTLKSGTRATDLATRVLGTLEDVGGLEGEESVSYAMANHYWYLDARKAHADLGFRARSPEGTLRDAVQWLRAQGPLPERKNTLGSLVRGVQRAIGRA